MSKREIKSKRGGGRRNVSEELVQNLKHTTLDRFRCFVRSYFWFENDCRSFRFLKRCNEIFIQYFTDSKRQHMLWVKVKQRMNINRRMNAIMETMRTQAWRDVSTVTNSWPKRFRWQRYGIDPVRFSSVPMALLLRLRTLTTEISWQSICSSEKRSDSLVSYWKDFRTQEYQKRRMPGERWPSVSSDNYSRTAF